MMALLDDLLKLVDIRRSEWGAAPSRRSRKAWPAGAPTNLELHHSVTPAYWGLAYAMRAIQRTHFGKGWADVFYNVGLHADGTTAEGAPWGQVSGSGLPSFTIVLLGNHMHDPVTPAQRARLEEFYRLLPHGMTYHQERAAAMGQPFSECCGTHAIEWVRLRRMEPPSWPASPSLPVPPVSPAPTSPLEDQEMPFVLHDSGTNHHWLATPGICTLRPLTVPDPWIAAFGKRSVPNVLRAFEQAGWRVVEAA